MTDSEIIKALHCCISLNEYGGECDEGCPYIECTTRNGCIDEMLEDVLDLINRQKAEISVKNKLLAKAEKHIDIERAEAIKEFAERLKELFPSDNEPYQYWEIHEGIDSLVKEMVGDSYG